jgi:hypothetical protein
MKYIHRLIAALGILALSGMAVADGLSVTPGDCGTTYVLGSTCWVIGTSTDGEPTANPDAAEISALVGNTVNELYRKEVDGGAEYGGFQDDYYTEFYNTPTDPAEATIFWNGPDFITCDATNPCYLTVKDGDQDPNVYVYDITAAWDGKEHIHMTGFWPEQGAISWVGIFGGDSSKVPEPGTMALLGLGLVGMGLMRRRRTS